MDKEFADIFNIFLEASNEVDVLSGKLRTIIIHLFKIKYSTIDRYKSDWENEIEQRRTEITKLIKRGHNLFSKIDIDRIYSKAISEYNSLSKNYKDLPNIKRIVNKECPWTAEEIYVSDIYKLIDELP